MTGTWLIRGNSKELAEGSQKRKRLDEELGSLRKKLKATKDEAHHLLDEADKLSCKANKVKSYRLFKESHGRDPEEKTKKLK